MMEPKGTEGSRDPQDEILIAALGEGCTHQRAADVVGLSAKTVQRRLQDPVFAQAVAERRRERASEIAAGLIGASTDAIRTLQDALGAENVAHRITAARVLLDLGRRYHQDHVVDEEVARRLDALETLPEQASARPGRETGAGIEPG